MLIRIQIKIPVFLSVIFLFMQPGYTQDNKMAGDGKGMWVENLASLSEISGKTENKLGESIDKYLSKLQKQEQKIKSGLWQKDTLLARTLFDGLEENYKSLRNGHEYLLRKNRVYSPRLDTLTTAIKFLMSTNNTAPELEKYLGQLSMLQDRLNQSEVIRNFFHERSQLFRDNLEKLGLFVEYRAFRKQAFYYSKQVQEFRQALEEPSKLEKKLLETVLTSDKFKNFFREHSQLAALFALPGETIAATSLQGLQTRNSVQQGITERFGAGPEVQQLMQQNLQAAQGQLSELKQRLSPYSSGSIGNSSSDIDIPEGFKPNYQKNKPFFERLEVGLNFQNQRASTFFPVTSDLGFSVGYKLSDNSSIGLGASYKIGWGRGWDHIRLTHEGIGLRSYVDVKLKGSTYFSGGYELNYRTAFSSVQQLKNLSAWQNSGLIGLSKKYQVSKKLKGDIKLLWDFLSYQQIPNTQVILFRLGFNFR